MFHLENDPGELYNLAETRGDILQDMDVQLREIVAYEDVHQRVLRYDREAFRQWRREVNSGSVRTEEYGRKGNPMTTYEEIMTNSYIGFGPEHEDKLQHWLSEE